MSSGPATRFALHTTPLLDELLFAVNGGAFAIAKLLGEKKLDLGKLHFPQVAAGMILFTFVMVFDIYTFGTKWHSLAKEIDDRRNYQIFGPQGRVVLIAIGLLLCIAWALASGSF
jgi:hypothetical protein